MAAHNKELEKKAPDFTLPDVDLKPMKSERFFWAKNRYSLLHRAFTETCTKSCEFRDAMFRLVDFESSSYRIEPNSTFFK